MFAAVLSNKDYNSNYKLTLKSKARRESLLMIFNRKYNLPPQTQFVENSCEVGIEKIAKGNSTEYITTVRNCTEQNIRKYFFIYILNKSENGGTVLSHNLDVPEMNMVLTITSMSTRTIEGATKIFITLF